MTQDKFPDWIREIEPELTEEIILKRRKAADNLAEQADWDRVQLYSRLFFGQNPESDSIWGEIRSAFREEDPLFRGNGNEHELRVLAGVILNRMAGDDADEMAVAGLLAMQVLSVQGWSNFVASTEILQDGLEKLEAIRRRSRDVYSAVKASPSPSLSLPPGALSPKRQAQEQTEQQEAELDTDEVVRHLQDALQNIESWAKQQTQQQNKLLRAFEFHQEELRMMWWFEAKHSSILDCSIDNCSHAERATVAGLELADCTSIIPGPIGVNALAKGIISGPDDEEDVMTLGDYFSAIPEDLIQALAQRSQRRASKVCPLHYLAWNLFENPSIDTNSESFGNRFHLTGETRLCLGDIAIQIYDETLLLQYDAQED